jgi:hypothetical protein
VVEVVVVRRTAAAGGRQATRGARATAATRVCSLLLLSTLATLAGCAASRPSRVDDACAIFAEQEDWLDDARKSYAKWGVPVPLQLAVIHQESRFEPDVRPPRGTFLWILPGSRPSSAYGYGQVLESTWDEYQDARGGVFADRDDFGDVVDFIGWYGSVGERRYGIPKTDPYAFYLSYHEGHAGYRRGTYRKKRRLLEVAEEVARLTRRYAGQLNACDPSVGAAAAGGPAAG